MRRVYLAGPPFAEEYRRRAERLLRARGLEPVDPMRRDFRGRTQGNEREIVEGDLAEIDSCDAVLASFTAPDEGTAHQALQIVEEAGVQAMNELHRMLGLLRAPDDGVPTEASLAELDALVERARKGGADVVVTTFGWPPGTLMLYGSEVKATGRTCLNNASE